MSRTIETIIENYITGNLKDAKRLAKRTSHRMIFKALRDEYGKTETVAVCIAAYLKGTGTLQAAYDAEKGKSK